MFPEDFILESVVGSEGGMDVEPRGRSRNENTGGGSVREVRMPLGLYHDRLHNVYIAAGTLGAAIAIVGVVVSWLNNQQYTLSHRHIVNWKR